MSPSILHYDPLHFDHDWTRLGQIPNLSRTEPRFYRGIVFINQTFKASPGSRYKLTDARLATAWAVHSLSPGRLVASTDILRVFAVIALIFIEYIQDHKIANLDFTPVFIKRTIFCVVKYFAISNECQWIGFWMKILFPRRRWPINPWFSKVVISWCDVTHFSCYQGCLRQNGSNQS